MLVFLMPGSPAAVRLAMQRLIIPELAHAVGQLRRPAPDAARGGHGHGHGPHHR
jgi:molybdopterin biosynthesis enzyme MoaB